MALLFKPHVTNNPAQSQWDQLGFCNLSGLLRWRYQGQYVGQDLAGPAIHNAYDQIIYLKDHYLCVALDDPPYGQNPAHDAATRLNNSSYRPNLSTPTVHFGWLNKFGHFLGCAFEHQDHFLRHTMLLTADDAAREGWIKITPETWQACDPNTLPTQAQRTTLKELGFRTVGRTRDFIPLGLEENTCQDPPMTRVTLLAGITIRNIRSFGDISVDGVKPFILGPTTTAERLAWSIAHHADNFKRMRERQEAEHPARIVRGHLRLVVG